MLPDWMKEEENYAAVKDSDRFLEKTLLKLMGTLSGLRHQVTAKRLESSAPVALLSALLLLILTACAKNMFFPYCMLALVLLGLCLLPGPLLKQSLGNIVAATGIAFLILLPSALLGNTHTLVTVCLKVFISVSLISLLNASVPHNQLVSGLRFFHIPNLFIFTLDTTLHYIVVLGQVCLSVLEALKLRSVGKNKEKSKSVSGVLGVTFLKSKAFSEEQYQAMVCRGFDGEYKIKTKLKLQKTDFLYLFLLLFNLGLFFFLERSV